MGSQVRTILALPEGVMPPVAPWQMPENVAKFLHQVRDTVPLSIEQIDMLLGLVGAARGAEVERFLDLGGGEAMLTAALLDEYPAAHGWLVDTSGDRLVTARQRFHAHAEALQFLTTDIAQSSWTRSLAGAAPFDVIVSGLCMDRLPDHRKRELYREIFRLLKPDGLFITIEHVASSTRWTESPLDDYLIDAIFGEQLRAHPRQPRALVARDFYSAQRNPDATLAPLEVQCDWLRAIGFDNVDCFLKVEELAVFGGQRPSELD